MKINKSILISSLIGILLLTAMGSTLVAHADYPTVSVDYGPYTFAYAPSNGYLYVTNQNSGTVSVINPAGNTVVGSSITVGSYPYGIVYGPDSNIYVANLGAASDSSL